MSPIPAPIATACNPTQPPGEREPQRVRSEALLRGGRRLIIDHVESPIALRGKGTAGRLMTAVASEARKASVKITPICGYAASWLQRSKDFSDLVA